MAVTGFSTKPRRFGRIGGSDEVTRDRTALTMCDIGNLHPQSHRPDEPLQLDGFSCETLANKRRLVDHPLPALALVLPRLDDLEHLLLCDTSDFWQGNSILCRLVFSAVFDGG